MPTTRYKLNPVSTNRKTGPIPVSTTTEDSCPATCPFINNGCYAKGFPLAYRWKQVEKIGNELSGFLKEVSKLRFGSLWRHNQAGDLPHTNGNISEEFTNGIIKANQNKRGFTYTHHILNDHNKKMIQKMNDGGFTVNVSRESLEEAVKNKQAGFPVACVVPSITKEKQFKFKDERFIVCPANVERNITCATCGLCQKADRKFIVAFKSHGVRKKTVDKLLS